MHNDNVGPATVMNDWHTEELPTLPALLQRRVEADPDGAYLDVCGHALTPAAIWGRACGIAHRLKSWDVARGDRVATLLDNSPEQVLAWWGIVSGGHVAVPINTAYKGRYLSHQLRDAGAEVLVVQRSLLHRYEEIAADLPALRHLVVVDDAVHDDAAAAPGAERTTPTPAVARHQWDEFAAPAERPPDVGLLPSDVGSFIYTGGTTGPSKGCMLSHGYHAALSWQTGICHGRTADDVLWTPLPLFHYNAFVTAVLGALIFGGRSAIGRRFSVSGFWPELNRTGATLAGTLGTMAYLLAKDVDRPEMPRSGDPRANTSLRLLTAAPLPPDVDRAIRDRFGVDTFSGAYGVTEASLVSWSPPGVANKPNAAGIVNDRFFDVRIFDDHDRELPRGTDGEIVVRPKAAHVMFEGYWGRPEATVETSRNWWYHTGDIGRIDDDGFLFFVDRKADYLRRRGENISSYEVESVLMAHGALADVVVHAVPSELTEDDLKVTAVLKHDTSVAPEDLFRWAIDQLPYFALPRYIEFRDELPRSPVGRVLKRQLRDEGVTPATWDAETSGVTYERR